MQQSVLGGDALSPHKKRKLERMRERARERERTRERGERVHVPEQVRRCYGLSEKPANIDSCALYSIELPWSYTDT